MRRICDDIGANGKSDLVKDWRAVTCLVIRNFANEDLLVYIYMAVDVHYSIHFYKRHDIALPRTIRRTDILRSGDSW